MAPPARKNHNFMVKVLVPHKVPASICSMESYQDWMMMEKTREGQNPDLSDFPDDLIESILERLSSADRIRFGATCKRNLSFVTTQQHPHRYQFRTIDKLPWIATIFLYCSDDLVFRLFEPLHRQGQPNYADYHILHPKGEIKACKKGWFLSLWPNKCKTSFLLFCPFNKRIVELPDLDHYLDLYDQVTCRATFSSDDPSSPDCVFFFLSKDGTTPEKYRISTLDQKTGKWKTKLFDKLIDYVTSVVYHEGCFYCLSILGELAAYDVVQHTWNLVILPSHVLHIRRGLGLRLVACEGKLIIAVIHSSSENSECNNNVDVFCCGLFEFSSSTSTWVERTSLGDHALFLGNPTSFSVPVPSCSVVADRMYFYSDRMFNGCPFYYSLKDGRCHMSEDGDYWSSMAKFGMWIEPPSPTLCRISSPKQGSTRTPNS